jgi:hypothetical protein
MPLIWLVISACTPGDECPDAVGLELTLLSVSVLGDTEEDAPQDDWLKEGTLTPRDSGNLWITGHAGGRIITEGGAVAGELADTADASCSAAPVLETGVWEVFRAPDIRLLGADTIVDGAKVVVTYERIDMWDAIVQYEIGEAVITP